MNLESNETKVIIIPAAYTIEQLLHTNTSNPIPDHTWIPKNDDGYLGENVYLWVYTGIVAAVFVLTKFRAIYFFMYCTKISVNVHNRMFMSLVRAPIKYFDDNPSGSI